MRGRERGPERGQEGFKEQAEGDRNWGLELDWWAHMATPPRGEHREQPAASQSSGEVQRIRQMTLQQGGRAACDMLDDKRADDGDMPGGSRAAGQE